MHRLAQTLLALAALAGPMTEASAADVETGAQGPFARLFGRAPPAQPLQAVPDYILREADREGALEVDVSPLEAAREARGRNRNVGRALDTYLFGLPLSPERELEDKYRRSQLPGAMQRHEGIFSGLDSISTGSVRGGPTAMGGATVRRDARGNIYSDGTPTNAAPRVQDVAKLCDDPRTLADILERFNWAQHNTYLTDTRIDAIGSAHERGYRTVGDVAYLSKRYCEATVSLNTGHTRRLVYQIVEDTGGAGGFYDRARFCVQGFDEMNESEPTCRVLERH